MLSTLSLMLIDGAPSVSADATGDKKRRIRTGGVGMWSTGMNEFGGGRTVGVAGRIAALSLALSFAAVSEAASTNFNGRGNEPSWHVQITEAGLSFRRLGGETFTISPTPEARIADGVKTYRATVDGQSFSMMIADALCVDTMSGMPHPNTVTVLRVDQKLSGCGGDPSSLLHGQWSLRQIDGKAIVADAQPTLAFGSDGRVSGDGSCNRFFGSYVLTGEGLSFSGLGTSRMACAQPILDQESSFMQILGAVIRFDIGSDGSLVLHGSDGRALLARRK